jgi:hypothetical protein
MNRLRATASRVASTLIVSCCVFSGVAAAQTATSDDWKYAVVIYGYFPSLGGSATFPASGTTANITVDANKVLSNLKFAFMGTLLAQKGQWGAFTDVVYADLGNSKSASRDLSIGGITIPAGITADLHLDLKSTLWTTAGSYRFVDTPAWFFDGFVGVRMIDLSQNLNYQLSADVPPLVGPLKQGSSSAGLTNWDAIVGAKGRVFFGDRREWFGQYYFDAGTGQSQYTWQAIGGVGYHFSWGEVIAAWRYIDYRFFSNRASSLTMNGPAVGVEFHW